MNWHMRACGHEIGVISGNEPENSRRRKLLIILNHGVLASHNLQQASSVSFEQRDNRTPPQPVHFHQRFAPVQKGP